MIDSYKLYNIINISYSRFAVFSNLSNRISIFYYLLNVFALYTFFCYILVVPVTSTCVNASGSSVCGVGVDIIKMFPYFIQFPQLFNEIL